MAIDKNGKPLPKGITYRPKEDRYMGRFMYHGESFTVYGKTLKEVRKSLEDLKYQVEHRIYFKESSVTFDAWFDIWINEYKKLSVKAGTVEVYKSSYNAYLKKLFGRRQLRDIRTDHIQAFYNQMAQVFSRNTLEVYRAILNGMYTQAIRNEIVQKNPVSNAVLPRDNRRHTIEVMSEEEQKLFLDYAKETYYYRIYELALSTGMRSGELRGLQWSDIDFQSKTIYVTHTLLYRNREYFLDSPKTISSERDIPMLDNVYHLLKLQQQIQRKEQLIMGKLWVSPAGFEHLVFTTPKGRPVSRHLFKVCTDKIIQKVQKDHPLFPHITPHTFRHTFATRSIERGIPPKVLQTILGHKDLATTMDTYAHVLPNTKSSEMQKLAGLFD